MVGFCCFLVEFLLIVLQHFARLLTTMEFIDWKTPPRLGNVLLTPDVKERLDPSSTSTSS
jgi:hypothetical protein